MKEGATTTNSLTSFSAGQTIAAKSFFLIGLDKYDQSTSTIADIFHSSGSLLSTKPATIILHNKSDYIDEFNYDPTDLAPGQSFERKAFSGGICVSAQNDGEFLGNNCDNETSNDFEIRNIPNPQNSQKFPEPRNMPSIPSNFDIQYSSSTMELIFNWNASQDYSGDNSTVTYKITDISEASSTLPTTNTSSTTAIIPISETDRDYKFSMQAFDKERFGSTATVKEITVPLAMPPSQTVLYSQNIGDALSRPFRWENYFLMTELEQQTEPLTLLQSGQPFTVELKAYQDWSADDNVYMYCPSVMGYRGFAFLYASSTWNSDTKILTIKVNSDWWLFGTNILCGIPQNVYIQSDYNKGYQFYGSAFDVYLNYNTVWHDNYWNPHQIDTNIDDLYFVIKQ